MHKIPLPERANIQSLGENKYKITLEPLFPGYGVTVGNSLRRVMLSSMPGSAVTGVKIKFVDHEFQTIPEVKEDVVQIILRLKTLRLKSHSTEPVRLSLKVKGEKVVTAADIQETDQVEVLNKDLVIATLDNKTSELDMELVVEQGIGYEPVEMRAALNREVGLLAIDAIFTPIKTVYYDISNVRVGDMTNYDKLELVVETDGSIDGRKALDIAASILVDHFNSLFSEEYISELAQHRSQQAVEMDVPTENQVDEPVEAIEEDPSSFIENLELSNRSKNALVKAGFKTLTQLMALSDEQIENIDGLGAKSVDEILELLGRK